MKDSGVSWIGEIPVDWEVVPLKSRFSYYKGLPITKADLTETGIAIISYGQIHSKMNSGTHVTPDLIRFVSDKYLHDSPQSLTQKGDILFADTSEDYSGIGNCVLVDVDSPLFAGYHTIIARPQDSRHSKYLAYLFQTDNWRSQLRSQASGIKVYSVTQKMLKALSIVLPPVNVGERMAAYLDTKCAKIDAIIARQQQVIEKLKAYKLSVITEAVTKGLNPDVPMKDSGIEWIGRTPIDWKVLKFGLVARVSANLVSPADYLDYPQISPESVEKDSGRILEYKTVAEAGVISWNHLFVRGQIIYSKIRPLLNKVAIAPFDGLCSADMYPIDTENDPRYIAYVMRSCYFTAQVGLVTENRVKMPKINQVELSKIMITLPPLKEQVELAEYLDKKCKRLDHVIEQKQALIDKLTEYKKSLVHEVVTGKREITADTAIVTFLHPVVIENLLYAKALLETRVVEGLGKQNKGHIQVQKCLFFIEQFLGVRFTTQYIRQKQGPYDKELPEIEKIMADYGWVYARKRGRKKYAQVVYTFGKELDDYRADYQRLFGDYDGEIQRIIDFVKPIKHSSEIGRMATLFAAWNDFILDGNPSPTDEQIISEVRSNWTDNKANTPVETWQDSLNKLRTAGMVPHGYGRHTVKLEEGDRTHG